MIFVVGEGEGGTAPSLLNGMAMGDRLDLTRMKVVGWRKLVERQGGAVLCMSILNADFSCLGKYVRAAGRAGVDVIHLDVMDGVFVPNLSFGFPVVEALRRSTPLPLDAHLMVVRPHWYVERLGGMGVWSVTVHFEAEVHLWRTVQRAREEGMCVGVALNPHTPVESLTDIACELDVVLVMSVNPGFGGQKTILSMLRKVERTRHLRERLSAGYVIQVDGGVTDENAADFVRAGAEVLVVGSWLVQDGPAGIAARTERLKEAIYGVV